jgi:hypothetical protein
MCTVAYTENSTLWDVKSSVEKEMEPIFAVKSLQEGSISIIPAWTMLETGDQLGKYFAATHTSMLIAKPLGVICYITTAALSLLALPEALVRLVILVSDKAICFFTGAESTLFGGTTNAYFNVGSPGVILFLSGVKCIDLLA